MNQQTPSERTTIVIADHQPLTRALIAGELARHADFAIVAEVTDSSAAVAACSESPARVLFIRADIPGFDPFAACRALRSENVPTKVVILAPAVVDRQIDDAIHGDVDGMMTFSDSPTAIVDGLRRVAAGGKYFSPTIEARIMRARSSGGFGDQERGGSRQSALTNREREILRHVAMGRTKKEIAATLGLSPKTVDNHSTKLMNKLDIHDRVRLARYAIREGLVSKDD